MSATDDAASAYAALERVQQAYAERDIPGLVAHLSAAVRGFTAAGEPCLAAMTCVQLGDVFANAMGNLNAGRAWFARAKRLVSDQPPCIEQGWVAVAAMGCDVDDPWALLADAELALDRARTFGDVSLETKALADAGLAKVQIGEVAAGMALLDESMALACGPADAGPASKSVCSFFTACYVSGDFERVGTWRGLLADRGLLSANASPESAFLSSHCDSVQAALLVEMGRWTEAETVLLEAQSRFRQAFGSTSAWHPDLGLADLRLRQGRLADAETLLLGKDQVFHAVLPAARLQLARGDHALARALAERGLRALGDDKLRAVELLAVLVDAELSAGNVDAAAAAAQRLRAIVVNVDVAVLQGRAAIAVARQLAASGALDAAIETLTATLELIDPVRLAWLFACLQVELAAHLQSSGDRATARLHAVMARDTLRTLDVVIGADVVALIDGLADAGAARASAGAVRLRRDGKWWSINDGSARARVPDTKGLGYLAELIAHPGCERHALDLVDVVEGVGEVARRSLGDAGETLDSSARTAYRHRIEALRADADEALGVGALERAESIQDEIEQLVVQLAAAFGLGGRDRRAASAAERARLNVTRAIRAAIAKLSELMPDAGAALDRGIRTGTYCVYAPAEGDIRWGVER